MYGCMQLQFHAFLQMSRFSVLQHITLMGLYKSVSTSLRIKATFVVKEENMAFRLLS